VLWFLDTALFVCKIRELMRDDLDALPAKKSIPPSSRLHAFFQQVQDSRRQAVRVVLEKSESNDGQADVAPTTTIPHPVFRKPSL
jgi:hypothetical protein